jgi:predicted transcriptional regulator
MRYIIPKQIELKTTKNEDLRKFCVMPLRAFLNPKISPYALRVLGVLASYCNRGGFSFVSLKKIGSDLGCTPQNVGKHLKKLEAFGIVESYKNYFPMLKGNTRRIIFDENIKREDLKEHDLHNSEITEILNNTILQNKVSGEDEKVPRVSQSENTERDELASLFLTITKEEQLREAEKLLAQGLTPGEVRIRMALGS